MSGATPPSQDGIAKIAGVIAMQTAQPASTTDQTRALSLSTIAFTACFAVWTIFSIIGVAIKGELGLNDTGVGAAFSDRSSFSL
jgi:hypothetical protein